MAALTIPSGATKLVLKERAFMPDIVLMQSPLSAMYSAFDNKDLRSTPGRQPTYGR